MKNKKWLAEVNLLKMMTTRRTRKTAGYSVNDLRLVMGVQIGRNRAVHHRQMSLPVVIAMINLQGIPSDGVKTKT